MHLIGFGHRSGTGKDCAARVLVDLGWQRLAFADPIRDILCDLDIPIRRRVDAVGWDEAKRSRHVRHRLEQVGESLRRRLGEHALLDTTLAQVRDGTVIADVRRPSEAEAILSLGGQVVRIDRDVDVLDPHFAPSDHLLADWDGWSAVIENNGSLEDLAAQVLAL